MGSDVAPVVNVFLQQAGRCYQDVLEAAVAAERLGYDGVYFADHLAAPLADSESDMLEAWTLSTAVAARTERIRVGHLVLCNQFRHPALIAKMVATLDIVSDGRFDLGLGLGGTLPGEWDQYGFDNEPISTRSPRLAESIEVIYRMLSGEPFDFDGTFWRLRGAIGRPRPRQAKIPLLIGGAGRRFTLPLVRRYADWWNCPGEHVADLELLKPEVGAARVSTQHAIAIVPPGEDRNEAEASARRVFGDWPGLLVGEADEIAQKLNAERAQGVDGFMLLFPDFGSPATLERFARDTLPRLV